MDKRTRLTVVVAAGLLAVTAGGAGVTMAAGGADDDADEQPITGADRDRAAAAALAHTGEGRVTATEVGDEESLYEVEVTLDDGTQIDVQLDEAFQVVGDEREGTGEDDGRDDGADD